MEKICGIYKITSPTGRIYIGESNNIYKRVYSYKSLNCKSQIKLHRSITKHGWDSHIFEILEHCLEDTLLCRERYWQDFYDVLNGGLNCRLTECGELKQLHSKETLQKMKKPKYERRGVNHHNWKKPLSKITKDKLSESAKNRYKNNPELAKTISKNRSGINHRQYGVPISEHQKNSIKEKNSKLVICLSTGIFYRSALEASLTYNIKYSTLRSMLNGSCKNKTNLIYC